MKSFINLARPSIASALILALLCPNVSVAHSVGQVQTAKRIARATQVFLDPQGNPVGDGGTSGSDTTARQGDILTFVLQFTPVPNGASRGAGGYITEYVPANTEVVGVRIIDALGNTIKPQRGPQMNEGWGPRARHDEYDALGLLQGSMAQLYADTGIFYSTQASTLRVPNDQFITIYNGIEMAPKEPSGSKALKELLGIADPDTMPAYAHTQWDYEHTIAYGYKNAFTGRVNLDGQGNTPFGFGSAVAGPQTHYSYETRFDPECSDGLNNDVGSDGADGIDYPNDPGCASALDNSEADADASSAPEGPWQRIKYFGSEIGQGTDTDCLNCLAPDFVRGGIPTELGWSLSADNPLPANTNAVRFAVGELIVGKEYFAEISLRVVNLPLDPFMGRDVNCAEVFGGDAAQPQKGQDNTWRYFVPSPACVQLNLVFALEVDKLTALQDDILTYTIRGKNLSTEIQTGVTVTDYYIVGDVEYCPNAACGGAATTNSVVLGPAPDFSTPGEISWPGVSLAPGEEYVYQWTMTVTGDKKSTINRATYRSDSLRAASAGADAGAGNDDGFSVVSLTNIEALAILDHVATVTPSNTTSGSTVQYSVTLTNTGTGVADVTKNPFINILLPPGFSYCPPADCMQPTVNNTGVGDPAIDGQLLTFTDGLVDIAEGGGTLVLVFEVTLDGNGDASGVSDGRYTIDIQSEFNDPGVNKLFENQTFELAPLIVGVTQSDIPTLDGPIMSGTTSVSGHTTEGQGALITVYVDGNAVATVVAGTNGDFTATVPTLYAGQRVTASAVASGEIESDKLSPEVIVASPESTGGDGGTATRPQCSDNLDNDEDGLFDYPEDPSCSSYLYDDESGLPACRDLLDNDGDGKFDWPEDPGCLGADDPSELTLPACANGVDDDNDGQRDYPNDPGCSSALDNDESATVGGSGGGLDGGAGSIDASVGSGGTNGGGASQGPSATNDGSAPNLGGLDSSAGTSTTSNSASSGDSSSCACRVGATPTPGSRSGGLGALVALGLTLTRRRRRGSPQREA